MPRVPAARLPLAERLEPRALFAAANGFAQADFVAGLAAPTAMVFAPDGRLLVCEQRGDLRVVRDGQLLVAPALSLAVDSQGERGLIGVAVGPDFAASQQVYVYYTTATPTPHNRISRFTLAGDAAVPGSERVLLDLPPLSAATNHNGGALHFGPDGMLYVGVGENAQPDLAQSLDTTFGKLLRLNPDGSVPADNPFVAGTAGQNRLIWATGLRNPYTFAFDPADGRMHVNDVGRGAFEEVDVGQAGANYGWPAIEGRRSTEPRPLGYVDPVLAYPHAGARVAGTCISGGAFYRADAAVAGRFPGAFDGDYLFADFGAGFVKSLDVATGGVADVASGLAGPVDVRVGPDGGVYVLEHAAGRVTRIAAATGDLSVEVVEGPNQEQAVQGAKDTVVVRVGNAGAATVRGRATVAVRLTTGGTVGSSVAAVGEVGKSLRLRPGQEKLVRVRFRYPADAAGTFRVLAEVRPAAGVADADAANNTAVAAGAVTVSPPAVDLAAAFRPPAAEALQAGRRGTVVVDVSNAGNVTFAGRVGVRLRLSADAAASDDDVVLATLEPKVKVAAGGARGVRVRFAVPAAVPPSGAYTLFVDLDAAGAVGESDEGNNGAATTVAVTAA